jgi:GTP-binding protein
MELNKLFSAHCEFTFGATTPNALPAEYLPEIGFIGRSNVGKSSLINTLLNRRIARTSNTPGRTQQLNFFELKNAFHIVDMPGYGYAKLSKTKMAEISHLIQQYLLNRSALRLVFILIDSRHGLKDVDRDMMKMLDVCGVTYQIILTKCDKIGKTELATRTTEITEELKTHVSAYPSILVSSSENKSLGIEDIKKRIYTLIFGENE